MAAARRGGWVIVASILGAFALTIVPLPGWAAPLRPPWVALVTIYWCLALPHRVGVGTAWLAGLILDVLRGGILGQNALALAALAYLAGRLHQRIRVFPLWQQALTVFVLLAVGEGLVAWIDGVTGSLEGGWRRFAPALAGMVVWPWVFAILRALRRRFGVT